jgi:8-oxo-dGTP pyrophosphatase MutT (NUDIX family)
MSKDNAHPYHTLGSKTIWRSPWYALRQDRIRLPDGSEGTYTVVEKPDAVWIIPVTAEGQIALIWNYRYAVDKWFWEIPAGSIADGASAEETARRELLEEIGGVAESLRPVARFFTMNGICNQVAHVFLATGVTLGDPHREPTEIMTVHTVAIARALDMAQGGEIDDGPSALALLLAAPHLVG